MTDATARDRGATVQTLDRGLRFLHLLAAHPDGLNVSELAGLLEVHRAIVYRLLGTLAQHRLVIRADDSRYKLWTGLVELARGVIPRWRSVAWPEIERLADTLASTAIVSVASEEDCVALLVAEPRTAPLHVAYQPGLRNPLRSVAFGTAILAGRPVSTNEPRTVVAARKKGIAIGRGEIQEGAVAIAAPIIVGGWAEASVGVIAFGDFDQAAERLVRDAAARIAATFPTPESKLAERRTRAYPSELVSSLIGTGAPSNYSGRFPSLRACP